jgi:hypothetical protein
MLRNAISLDMLLARFICWNATSISLRKPSAFVREFWRRNGLLHVAFECHHACLTKTRWNGSGNEHMATGGNILGLRGLQPIEFPLTPLL